VLTMYYDCFGSGYGNGPVACRRQTTDRRICKQWITFGSRSHNTEGTCLLQVTKHGQDLIFRMVQFDRSSPVVTNLCCCFVLGSKYTDSVFGDVSTAASGLAREHSGQTDSGTIDEDRESLKLIRSKLAFGELENSTQR